MGYRPLVVVTALASMAIACNIVAGLDPLEFADRGGDGGGQAGGTTTGGGGSVAAGGSTAGGGGAGGSGGMTQPPSPYALAVLSDSPVAYWRLGEAAGTTAVDTSNSMQDGLYVGVALGAEGAIDSDPNTAASFDGASANVIVGDVLGFSGGALFSLEAWVKPADTQTAPEGICGKRTGFSNTQGYLLRMNDGRLPAFLMVRNDIKTELQHTTPLPTDGFTHLVAVYDGVDLRLHMDGQEVASLPTGGPMIDHSAEFIIGDDVGNDHFHGIIDEVAVYDYALAPDRIMAHYALGHGG